MLTWFDALLITLLAMMTALGARRGLAGLIWGLSSLAVCLVAGALGIGLWLSLGLALVLGMVAAFAISRLIPDPLAHPWQVGLGALGGLLFGGLIIGALALNFPYSVQATPRGAQLVYPSTSLPPVLFKAVQQSALKNSFKGVWTSSPAVKTLFIPDRVVPKKKK